MTQFEIYTFILCCIVFVLLTVFFVVLLGILIAFFIRMLRHGVVDHALLREYQQKISKPKRIGFFDVIAFLLSACVCIAILAVFGFSLYVGATEGKAANGVPSLKVVQSGSMSYADQKNTYLKENNVNNHLQTFDLILTEHLPDEFDLKLYDVVVYEQQNGEMVIHRIVGIEEPNEKHPDCRHFKLQGDAVPYPDSYPVLYSQMRGIWTGMKVPFVGSFIMFMQSPAGWLCILLILFALFTIPIVEKKFKREKEARLAQILHGLDQVTFSTRKAKREEHLEIRPVSVSKIHVDLKLQQKDPNLEIVYSKTNGDVQISPRKRKTKQ